MFPINLQKNIDQLGRQISLLENECKTMEVENKRRSLKIQPSFVSKASDIRNKPSAVKIAVKKTNSSRKLRKSTPPASARLPSTSSHCTKTWSEIGGTAIRRKGFRGPLASSELLGSSQTTRRENKCLKCVRCNEADTIELGHGDSTDKGQKGHVFHKELLFPDSGGTIEVTVTQKPSNGKENALSTKLRSPRKIVNLGKDVEGESQGCKCQARGQKWAQILCSDPSKKGQLDSGSSLRNKITDEIRTIPQDLNLNNQQEVDQNEYCNNNIKPDKKNEILEVPVKLPSQSYITKQQSEININKFDKETQCSFEKHLYGEQLKGVSDPKHNFNNIKSLLSQILQRPTDESGKLTISVESLKKLQEGQMESAENKNLNSKMPGQNTALVKNVEKSSCENLRKETEFLSQELAAKDKVIAALRKREDDYVKLISNLKTTLEKTKGNALESADAMKEINFLKTKLLQQLKISEAMKKSHTRMQEVVEQCTLENDKLKTEIKIYKLEGQKHEVLLAGKEAQINRYKEEIQNFQRQISDHLASLKSNAAQNIDLEKMMEAIVQQTQMFTQAEELSVSGKDAKNNSELQNALIHSTPHSSPTSAKTSIVNSSWKRISSIHGHDISRANSDLGIYLNEDSNKKDFFQIFQKSKPVKKSKERSVEELSEKKEVKRSSSFTSCLTLEDDQNSSKSDNRNSLMSKESINSANERSQRRLEKESRVSLEVAQSNIDKLLRNMKLKFSKEIFDTSLPSCSTEDFLDFSQISSMSPVQ